MAVAATLPLFVATAVSALGEADPQAAGEAAAGDDGLLRNGLSVRSGFNTNRQEIGRGDSALGPYIMYTSTGPEGICALVELPESSPAGARAFYSDCSKNGDPPLNSATIVGKAGTLTYGLVPEETASVEVDRAAGEDPGATLRSGPGVEGKKFFVASSAGPGVESTIRAVGANGREIAAKALPRIEPEQGTP